MGSPRPARPSATTAPVTALMQVTTIRPASVIAWRPTAMDRIRSSRPASSSARVRRPIMNKAISAMPTRPVDPIWNATCPPIVSSAWSGPLMAIAAALPWIAAAAWLRAAGVG
jgi:hypothetical protein